MAQRRQVLTSLVVVTAAVVLLAKLRNGSLDIAGAVVLIGGLVIFARALIRLASEAGAGDQAARSR